MYYSKFLKSTLSILLIFFSVDGYCQYEQLTINESNIVIDGEGGLFNDGKATYLLISSKETTSGWIQAQDITIRNCTIRGGIRIIGLGRNGQAVGVKESSLTLGHTERAQALAPTNIIIQNVVFEATQGLTPLYLAPGSTYVTVENCSFNGTQTGSGPIVYLDAESGYNIFRNNQFNMTSTREVIACDGSANNLFDGNNFNIITKGGIYLYRNCGEGGAIRHQTPCFNTITNNVFNLSNLSLSNYGVWLGSRSGNRKYCDDDAGYPFGSSIDNRDFADNNTVSKNTFVGGSERFVKDDGANNSISVTSGVNNLEMDDNIIEISNNVIIIYNQKNNTHIRIYNSMGRLIVSIHSKENRLEFSNLSKGIYFISLIAENRLITKKVIL